MKPELRDMTGALRAGMQKAQELNALTDQLNRGIAAIEQTFAAFKLGVRASVRMSDAEVLVFAKSREGWRFEIEERDGSLRPLLNASRDARLRAIDFFGPLFSEMVATAERTLARVEEANAGTQEFVDAVNRAREEK